MQTIHHLKWTLSCSPTRAGLFSSKLNKIAQFYRVQRNIMTHSRLQPMT